MSSLSSFTAMYKAIRSQEIMKPLESPSPNPYINKPQRYGVSSFACRWIVGPTCPPCRLGKLYPLTVKCGTQSSSEVWKPAFLTPNREEEINGRRGGLTIAPNRSRPDASRLTIHSGRSDLPEPMLCWIECAGICPGISSGTCSHLQNRSAKHKTSTLGGHK